MKKTGLVFVLLAAAGSSNATVGINDYGYGVVSKSMGGTGVAQPQNAMSLALNPANLILLGGDNLDLGFEIFSPRRSYEASNPPVPTYPPGGFMVAPGKYESGSKWFFIPYIAYVKKLNERIATGIGFYANGGDNTNWPGDMTGAYSSPNPGPLFPGVYGAGRMGGELRQMFINIPLSVKVSDRLSVGASLLTLAETISVNGVGTFAPFSIAPLPSTPPNYTNSFTNNNTSTVFGFGGLFGATAKLTEKIALGLSYQSKITPSVIQSYRGLFPGGTIEAPAKITAGFTVHPTENTTVNMDYQHIYYENTRTFGNPLSPIQCFSGPCLGISNGAGFGYKDTNGIKVGGEWQANENYTFRLGYAHNNNPVQADQALFGILAPAVTKDHFTLGLARNIGKKHRINGNFLYVPKAYTHGYNSFYPLQTIDLSMSQYEFGLGWTWLIDKEETPPSMK